MSQRGVSPVVGMVVLVGLVAVVSVSLLVVGASVADSTRDAAQTEQVETSMSQFAETADAVATGGASGGEFQIGSASADGTAWTDGDAGQIQIDLARNATGNTTLVNSSLGAYRYQLQDGTEFAYQAGGVWRLDDDYPSMVRPPEFEYRASPAPTLTFPHVRVSGDATGSGSIQGELSVANERSQYPINVSLSNPIEGEYITVAIESRYCEGWERHVDQRTDAAFDERCGSNGRLIANMTVGDRSDGGDDSDSDADGDLDGAVVGNHVETNDWNSNIDIDGDVVYSDYVTPTNGSNDSDAVVSGDVRKINDSGEMVPLNAIGDQLEDHVDNGSGEWEEFQERVTYTGPDTHYLKDIDLTTGTLHIDAEDHDQTVVIRDDMILSSQDSWLSVDGDHEVRIFVNGSVELNGNPSPRGLPSLFSTGSLTAHPASSVNGRPGDPANLTIVAGDEFQLTGDTALYGVVVTPDATATVESGDPTLTGAIVGDRVHVQTGEVVYAADGWQFGEPEESDDTSDTGVATSDLYYLHVSETELDVDA